MTNEYYIPKKDNNPKIPILGVKGSMPQYFIEEAQIDTPEFLHFRIGKPKPRNPIPGDVMFLSNLIVSKKIFDVLLKFPQHTFQLLSADIDFESEILTEYWGLHIFQRIECLDREKCDCIFRKRSIFLVKKLVLDHQILEKIPLEKRLIFRLKEDSSRKLFHESVVEKIIESGATGVEWVNLADATTSTLF